MELPSLFQRQEFPSVKERFGEFRGQMVSLVAGNSVMTTGNVLPSSKQPASRLGLRLFSGERVGNSQSCRNSPSGRSHSSTRSFIDPNILSAMTVQPSVLTNMSSTDATRIEVRPTQRNQLQGLNSFLTWSEARRATTGAWVRRSRRKREMPQAHRYCCGPGIKTEAAKKKIIHCVASGILLVILLAVYLGLAFANVTSDREFHVLLILFIMLLTILFCHSFIRLFMIALKPPPERISQLRIPSRVDGSGYAQPDEPIPVFLARDEEITAGNNMNNTAISKVITMPPPAYGVWRSTVRLNPNLVYWQLADQSGKSKAPEIKSGNDRNERRMMTHRPPSYVSDDGVQYVVNMPPRPQPQSQAHHPDILPTHPTERGQQKR